jgi:Asp-tRNA(Asn)/Glu-tRNA(Gln) amidotransferase A subunit family amidase
MARSVQDLVVAARVLFGAPDKARDVAPVPFRDVELPQKLKFGFYVDGAPSARDTRSSTLTRVIDGFVRASPANERAVREAAEALRARGHECVEIDWPYSPSTQHMVRAWR